MFIQRIDLFYILHTNMQQQQPYRSVYKQKSAIGFSNNVDSVLKFVPKKLSCDKQQLYAQSLTMKKIINYCTSKNTQLKTRVAILQKQNGRLSKQKIRTGTFNSLSSCLKLNLLKANQKIRSLQQELQNLRKLSKIVKGSQMEIEKQQLYDEIKRMKNFIEEKKGLESMQHSLKKKIEMVEGRNSQLLDVCKRLNAELESKINQVSQLQLSKNSIKQKLNEVSTKYLKEISQLKQEIKFKSGKIEDLQQLVDVERKDLVKAKREIQCLRRNQIAPFRQLRQKDKNIMQLKQEIKSLNWKLKGQNNYNRVNPANAYQPQTPSEQQGEPIVDSQQNNVDQEGCQYQNNFQQIDSSLPLVRQANNQEPLCQQQKPEDKNQYQYQQDYQQDFQQNQQQSLKRTQLQKLHIKKKQQIKQQQPKSQEKKKKKKKKKKIPDDLARFGELLAYRMMGYDLSIESFTQAIKKQQGMDLSPGQIVQIFQNQPFLIIEQIDFQMLIFYIFNTEKIEEQDKISKEVFINRFKQLIPQFKFIDDKQKQVICQHIRLLLQQNQNSLINKLQAFEGPIDIDSLKSILRQFGFNDKQMFMVITMISGSSPSLLDLNVDSIFAIFGCDSQ